MSKLPKANGNKVIRFRRRIDENINMNLRTLLCVLRAAAAFKGLSTIMSPESRPSSFVIAKLARKKTCSRSSLQERKVFCISSKY